MVRPGRKVHPSKLLVKELEAHGLIIRSGDSFMCLLPLGVELLEGTRDITPEDASVVSEHTGITAGFWLRLWASWIEWSSNK